MFFLIHKGEKRLRPASQMHCTNDKHDCRTLPNEFRRLEKIERWSLFHSPSRGTRPRHSHLIDMTENDVQTLTSFCQTTWDNAVESSLGRLNRLSGMEYHQRRCYQTHELFMNDKNRFTVKKKTRQALSIFPWFVEKSSNANHRYRETLLAKNGEIIDMVTDAINYFCTQTFEEADFESLRTYYQHGPPLRTLWSIVQLQSHLESDRFARETTALEISNRDLSARLLAMEEQIRVLLQSLSTPSSLRSGKRKGDWESDNNESEDSSNSPAGRKRDKATIDGSNTNSGEDSESQSGIDEASTEGESDTSFLVVPLDFFDLSTEWPDFSPIHLV
jgi:hypothetical protein